MPDKIRIFIRGIEYLLTTEETEEYMQEIAAELTERLDSLTRKSPFLSASMISSITALSLLDENKKLMTEAEQLRAQLKDYIEQSATFRLEINEARREIERLNLRFFKKD